MPPRNKKPPPDPTSQTRLHLIAAAMALIGTLGAAYIAYLGVRLQAETPIRATQTAIAQLTSAATRLSPVSSTDIPPLLPTANLVSSTPNPAMTPTSALGSWADVVRLDTYCGAELVLPDYIVPDQDIVKAQEQITEALNSGDVFACHGPWQIAPLMQKDSGKRVTMRLLITSIVTGREWIEISNSFAVIVRNQQEAPSHVNIIALPIGSGGDIRTFPPISLDSRFSQYNTNISINNVDFFSLEPGEFEAFGLFFDCNAPGSYNIEINVPYRYERQKGKIDIGQLKVICPKSLTLWEVTPDASNPTKLVGITRIGNYVWGSTGYVQAP